MQHKRDAGPRTFGTSAAARAGQLALWNKRGGKRRGAGRPPQARHPAYDALLAKAVAVFRDPARTANYAAPELIAEVVYEAATDGKDQLRYIAGDDAKAVYAQRQEVGDEAFRKALDRRFFG